MSRDSAKAHYSKQPGDPDEGFITASDAQAAIDDIYDDMSAPAVIADGSVTSGKIAADAVGSAQIATGAVGSGELATDAVTSDKIADGAVSNAHVASDAAIAASKVAGTAVTQADTGTVTNGMLAGSIAKTKVAGTAITAADTGTVTGTMIGAGEVGNGNLAANAVNAAKIASGAVTTVKIEDDAVTTAKIAADAVTSAEIAANAVGASELADNAVDTAAIAADAVTADKIANDTITAAELAAGSVGTSELADDSVTAAKILDGTITANEIQNASITGVKLVNDTITATQIAANAVGAPELADDSVDTAAIQSKAVTAAKIADDTITATQVAANAIGSSELADSAVDTAAIADGAITSAKIADGTITSTDVAADTFAAFGTVGNLLTANQASIETDTTGWTTDGANSVAKSTAQARVGSASLLVTSPTNANYGGSAVFPTGLIPVDARETYTFMASVLTATGTRTQRLTVAWYTSGNSYVSGNYTVVANPTSWTDIVLTAVAPATAAKAYLIFGPNVAGADGDAAYWDRFSFHKGAGGQWAMPGTPIVGLSSQATNGAVHLSGTGAPEGVVTAAPGSTWLQTDSTVDVKGWIKWVKATGTGSTGWVAGAEADTGWRNVTPAAPTGWTSLSSVFIRRVGNSVEIRFGGAANTAGLGTLYNAPSGFRNIAAAGDATGSVNNGSSGAGLTTGSCYMAAGSGVLTVNREASTNMFGSIAFLTTEAWPTSLPGSAA